jgi:hypothetical protein
MPYVRNWVSNRLKTSVKTVTIAINTSNVTIRKRGTKTPRIRDRDNRHNPNNAGRGKNKTVITSGSPIIRTKTDHRIIPPKRTGNKNRKTVIQSLKIISLVETEGQTRKVTDNKTVHNKDSLTCENLTDHHNGLVL